MKIQKRVATGLGISIILFIICAGYIVLTAHAQTDKQCTACKEGAPAGTNTMERPIDPDPDPDPDPGPDPSPPPPPADCPRCYNDQNPFGGRFGNAASQSAQVQSDFSCNCPAGSNEADRRVIKVRIDGSWDSSPGHTNDRIWNAVVCALKKWNTTRDSTGYTTGYFFVIDQSEGTPDILIKREQADPTDPSVLGAMDIGNTTTRVMHLTPGVELETAASDCGRVSHEIGHGIGLKNTPFNSATNAWNCVSIMAGANANGTRAYNNVTTRDVDMVNKQFNASTRGGCTGSILDAPGTEGHEGTTCVDMDDDGWSVCDGDCNDNDASLAFNCSTNGCTDADGDGWCNTEDCNDYDASVQSCTTYYDPYPYYQPPSYQCYDYYRVTDYYQYSGEGNTWIYISTVEQYLYTECYYSY